MKTTVGFLLLLAGLLVVLASSQAKKKEPDSPVLIPDRYIITFKDPNYKRSIRKLIKFSKKTNIEVKISKEFHRVLSGVAAHIKDKYIDQVRALDFVDEIVPESVLTAESARYRVNWGLDRLDQHLGMEAFDGIFDPKGEAQKPVYVYVLDTGINVDHEDFGGRAEAWFDAVGDGRNGHDCSGHGTHCAGIVGSNTFGVATNALLRGVRVTDCWGDGHFSSILAGIDRILEVGEKPGVVSISLKTSPSSVFDKAVQTLINDGFVVVVAAGNNDNNACWYSPARVKSVITVGATDFFDKRSDDSNYGSCVDIFAPGEHIRSTWIDSTTDTAVLSGTSMACPFVAGYATLLLGNNPNMTHAEVKDKILSTSTKDRVKDPKRSPNRLLFVNLE